ncbi:MAG: hypothetical protein IIC82_03325 [Chloroflexi bacterium]|nr:hypothetical protein [Chloroflexota bacterium]
MPYNEGVAWQGSAPPVAAGSGEWRAARLSPQGHSINKDWIDQMIDDGLVYSMEWGTENAPVAWTAVIDDILVFGVLDNPVGRVLIPLYCEINIATWSTSALVEAMLEADTKARYVSGGTSYTPKNLRTDKGAGSQVTSAFTAGASDVVAALGDDLDVVIDGECLGGIASTVLDLTHDAPRIVRVGAISKESLEAVIGDLAIA